MKIKAIVFALILLPVSVRSAQQTSTQPPVIQKISQAIEIYSSRRKVQRATPLMREIERDLGPPAVEWTWAKRPSTTGDALQKARYALAGVEAFFRAKTRWKQFSQEDQFTIEELAAERYNCGGRKDQHGNYVGGFTVDRCIANALAEAKRNRDLAVEMLSVAPK